MKFLTRDEINNMSQEEIRKFNEEMLELRRFACAMVKDVSKSSIGKLENRCYGMRDQYVSYESSMFIYLTNAIYRHILGEENLEAAKRFKNRAYDEGKTGVTTPAVLSLPALMHLKNFYKYIENKLVENPRIRFHGDGEVQDFLRETRKEYAKDISVNFAFTGRSEDCTATSTVAKPISSLDKLIEGGRVKNSGNYPVFDEYTIKSMRIYEYLLTRAKAYYRSPQQIKAMEEALEAERLEIVDDLGKSSRVREFYKGTVSEVLKKMEFENEKAIIAGNASKGKKKVQPANNILSETAESKEVEHGGKETAFALKKAILDRNTLGVSLVAPPSSTKSGIVKGSAQELKKVEPEIRDKAKAVGLGRQTQIGDTVEDTVSDEAEPAEEAVVEEEEVKTPEYIRDLTKEEEFKLRYMAAKQGLTPEELKEEIRELRSKPYNPFEEESKKYYGKQLSLLDENGELNPEVIGETSNKETMGE